MPIRPHQGEKCVRGGETFNSGSDDKSRPPAGERGGFLQDQGNCMEKGTKDAKQIRETKETLSGTNGTPYSIRGGTGYTLTNAGNVGGGASRASIQMERVRETSSVKRDRIS